MDKLFEHIVELLKLVDSDLSTMGKVRQTQTLLRKSQTLEPAQPAYLCVYGCDDECSMF